MASHRCLAVMYHYIGDRPAGMGGIRGLSARQFEDQLDELSSVLEPTDWPTLSGGGVVACADVPERTFLLTFDDGLADHYRTVAPILSRRGLRGVFLVPGAVLETDDLLPAHCIHLLLDRVGADKLCLLVSRWLERNGFREDQTDCPPAAVNAMYHYEDAATARLKYLLTQRLEIAVRNRMLTELFAEHVGDGPTHARRFYMTIDQLGELQAAGHTIGGHGFGHEPYNRLTPEQQRHDADRVWESLTRHLGQRHRPFSYPYGACDASAADSVSRARFDGVFSTQHGWINGPTRPTARLPRVDTIAVGAFLSEEPAWATR